MADTAAMNIVIGANVQAAITGLDKVQSELTQTATAAAKINSTMQMAGKGTDQATQAFTNLGRVVQDAPFGFMGIANNLNPLLESFQRLKATTGSTGTALKAMGGALMGPAGIGFALSAVSSLLVVFGDKLFASAKGAEALRTTTEALNDAMGGIKGQLIQVQTLAKVLTDSTESLNRRKIALQELQKIDKDHFGTLSLQKSSYEDITKAVDNYTASLTAQVKTKAAMDVLGEAETARLKAEVTYITAANKVNAENLKMIKEGITRLPGQTTAQREAFIAATDLSKATEAYNERLKLVQSTVSKGLDFIPFKPEKVKAVKDIKKGLEDTLPTLEQYLALSRQIYDSTRGATVETIVNIKPGEIDPKKIETAIATALPEIPITPVIDNEQFEKIIKQAEILQGVFENIFSDIAENGKFSIDSLTKSIEQLIIKLAAAAAAAALLSLIPGAAGFMEIFGKLTNLKGIIPGMAAGGIVTAPQMRIVGEAGPEAVIPINRLREFLPAAGSQVVVMETQIRGDDLYLIQSRTAARRGRAY